MLIKAFRLFVSSTFQDFKQERELLQSKVFPYLDAYCARRGYQFHAVDLRWGVSEEAQLDQGTVEICLGEVSAAKSYPPPNFLVMIGDRYGWVPLPFAIAQDEFEGALAWLESSGNQDARYLRHVYELDENHVIPCGLIAAPSDAAGVGTAETSAYTLRSREDQIGELKDAAAWEKLEARLRTALQAAADHLLRSARIDAAGYQKYFLSLTEQEIIRGLPGYTRDAAGDATATPKMANANGSHAIAWVREKTAVRLRPAAQLARRVTSSGPEMEPQVAALVTSIRRALAHDCVSTAATTVAADGSFDQAYLDTFVLTIQRKLEAAIDKQIAIAQTQERTSGHALQSERAEQRAFIEERRRVFIGRESNRMAIDNYIAGSGVHPLVVHGRSGSGKSALMASAVADAEAANRGAVIYRFVGASAVSSGQRAMLESLVDDLADHGVAQKQEQWEDDPNKFVAQVREVLLAIDKPVAIFLDALDQLRKPYRPGWLPDNLPETVKIVVSALDDEAYPADCGIYKNLRERLPADAFLEIEPLTVENGHDMLVALEQAARRRLQPSQRDYIVGQFIKAGASPLYLRVAFEIARRWRSTYRTGEGGREFANDTKTLIAQLIDELSTVHHHEPELVSRALGYIAAAKDGLSASELTDILSHDTDVMQATSFEQHGARTSKLPVSVWVRLHRHLAALLVEKRIDDQPLMQFFHRELAEVARERCYVSAKAALHGAMAKHFDAPAGAMPGAEMESKEHIAVYSKRSLSELPYQLHHAKSRSRLDEILVAPDWMQQKLNAFGPHALVDDYDQYATSDMQRLLGRTLRLIAGICARDPRQLLPQILGRLIEFPAAESLLRDVHHNLKRPAIVPRHASLTPPGAEIGRLEGHSAVKALVSLPNDRLASGCADGSIVLWDLNKGIETARLEGHGSAVHALLLLPDGCLASGSSDATIRLWDLNRNLESACLVGHEGSVFSLCRLPDSRLASGANDTTIRLWNVEERSSEVAELEDKTLPPGVWTPYGGIPRYGAHMGGVTALILLPDAKLASAASDAIRIWDLRNQRLASSLNTGAIALAALDGDRFASASQYELIFWDGESGREISKLSLYSSGARALIGLPDNLLAVSADKSIALFDVDSGQELRRLQGHSDSVSALALLPNGRLASGSDDRTIRVWEPRSTLGTERQPAHRAAILALCPLRDGLIASGSADNTIGVWDMASGNQIAQLTGHAEQINALVLLPDGRLASGSEDSTLRIWDLRSWTESGRADHGSWVRALAVLPNNRLVSTCSFEGETRIWDLITGKEINRFEGPGSMHSAFCVLPDGRLACSSWYGPIELRDPGHAKVTLQFRGPKRVIALAALSDGSLASGLEDGTIQLWDVNSGAELACFRGHAADVVGLAGLSDGCLASGSKDGTVRIWNRSGMEISRLELDGPILSLTSLPGGGLAAGDQAGRLHLLQIFE